MADVAVRVDGLAQFSRNLKKLDSDLPKALRLALNQSAELVVTGAQGNVPSRSGKARRSIRAASTRTEARVRAGGNRAPYYPWLDFGGRVGRGKSVRRPFLKDGRYLYATYFKLKASGQFQDAMTKALLGVVEDAGIGVD
jgi:hypothetical protein